MMGEANDVAMRAKKIHVSGPNFDVVAATSAGFPERRCSTGS
jgi:hypothetical protein